MSEVYRGFLPGESTLGDVPIVGPVYSSLFPIERDVIKPPETTYEYPYGEDAGFRYATTTPGEYGEPRYGTPAAVQGILDFVQFLKKDPKAAASAIGEGIMSIPEQQYYGGLALLEGADRAYNPETEETYTYDPFLIAGPQAVGSNIAIRQAIKAGDRGTFVGMLASADTPGINPKFAAGIKKAEGEAQARLEAGEDPRKVFADTGFMRINVDSRPDRGPNDPPMETRMVFDIPDDLSKINVKNVIPESVLEKVSSGASGEQVLDAFESLKNPREYFVENFYAGGEYGRSVNFKLSQIMGEDHPLFEVFPNLGEEINVRFVEKPGRGSGGHWREQDNTIAIGAQYLNSDRFTATTMVHEIMHVLQTRGDLPGGSAPFLVPARIPSNILKNIALLETTKALSEPQGPNGLNVFEFLEGYGPPRPKGEKDDMIKLIDQARFNVKNANPGAPDNLARMWPGSLYSSAPQDLDNMPYAAEVKTEMLRLIEENEARAQKVADTYAALGIDYSRQPDRFGSLKKGPSAQGNYYRTRGEFMARLAEAYAVATEGRDVASRRKLFPMDLANPQKSIQPSPYGPGGAEGIAGINVGRTYGVLAGEDEMRGTMLFDRSGLVTRYPSERGLVDIASDSMGGRVAGGLINVDKLPPEIKNKIEYPRKAVGVQESRLTGFVGGSEPERFFHGTGSSFKDFNPDAKYTFVTNKPRVANFFSVGTFEGAPNIRPVYIKDGNFFDPKNPDHLQKLSKSDWYKANKRKLRKHPLDRTFLRGEGKGSLKDDYAMIESTGLDDALREMGYDGFTTYEMGAKNLAIFNTENIVPGVAKKAEGGVISLVDVARNMIRGPRGVESLVPVARNMNRPMVS